MKQKTYVDTSPTHEMALATHKKIKQEKTANLLTLILFHMKGSYVLYLRFRKILIYSLYHKASSAQQNKIKQFILMFSFVIFPKI